MEPGDVVGSYVLERRLGAGAHGEVWLAQDSVGQGVALKLLKAELIADPDLPRRFRREAQLAQTIRSPQVVRCLDAGEHHGRLFLVTELVTGGDLEGLLSRSGGRLPRPVALAAAADILRGLIAIHEAGLVHRDIKPANVMLDDQGRAKVADLGLARPTDDARTRFTADGMIVGSPAYLSPEAIRADDALDIRSDLYALGVLLWQCLTGALPFSGATVFEILRHHLDTPAPRLAKVVSGCPPALAEFVASLLAKDASARPVSPAQALERLLPLALADGAATLDADLLATQIGMPGTLPDGAAGYFPPTLADGGLPFPGTIPDGGAAYPVTIPDGGAVYPATIPDGVAAYPPTIPDGGSAYPSTIPDGATLPSTLPDTGKALARGGFAPRQATLGGEPTLAAEPSPVTVVDLIANEQRATLAELRLDLPGGGRVFLYAGPRLQCGRDGRGHGTGNDVCLRLFPAQEMADATRRISGRHCALHASAHGVELEDLGSSQGTQVDGALVPPGSRRALRDGSMIRVGGALTMRCHLSRAKSRYRVSSVGESTDSLAVLLRRPDNRSEHAYLLVSGSVRLGLDASGMPILDQGTLEVVALAGKLWRRDGKCLRPCVIGESYSLGNGVATVAAIHPSDHKE